MNLAVILPILLSSLAGQERSFAMSEGVALLSAENTRVKAGLDDAAIMAIVTGLVTLAFAEQNALVAVFTAKAK